MKRSGKQNDKGFTLIEIIITIVMVAIMGTMGLTYMSTSLTKSAQLLNQAKKAMTLQQVMENIFTDYNLYFKSDLTGIKERIGTENAECNSGATTCVYGKYTVKYNRFIKFDNYKETSLATGDPQNMLKVTIKNDSGETLSILLTVQ